MELSSTLLLLFDVSQHKVRSKFDAFVAEDKRVSIDPLGPAGKSQTTIISDGLTYQCDWSASQTATAEYRKIFSTTAYDSIQSALGLSLHPHIADGLRIPEIARAYFVLGASLAKQLGAVGVVWQPSALQTGIDYYIETIETYMAGGVFPVLPTIDFLYDDEGHALRSNGLSVFCGQEFELRSDQLDRQDLMRRAIRFAHDLATNGAVAEVQDVPDLDADKVIHLVPSTDGKLLQCTVVSQTDKVLTLG